MLGGLPCGSCSQRGLPAAEPRLSTQAGSYWLPLREQRRLGPEEQLQPGAPAGEEGTLPLPAP